LLIRHGADPALVDAQGFDTFHLATHSSSPFLLAYLLSQQLPVLTDTADRDGRTCLQWACYQGDAISVELLLRYGADPNKTDPGGLTALHWAVVKGNVGCIARVVDRGGQVTAKNNQGQTPLELAGQLKSVAAWNRAMLQLGRHPDGRPRSRPLSERSTSLAVLLLPTALLGLVFRTLAFLPWYTGLPFALAEFAAAHHFIVRVLLEPNKMGSGGMDDRVTKSPYLCGLVAGSLFWVGWVWVTRIIRGPSLRPPLLRASSRSDAAMVVHR
jgi:palmitoyltransferase ZDHHC13/17